MIECLTGCESNEKMLGVARCCKYENLISGEFVYNNFVLQTSNRYYNSLDVQQFIIANSDITKIPNNLFQNMKVLEYLDVVYSGVKNINVDDFLGAGKLIHLNLTKNSIKSLEPKLFVYAQNLLILDLSFNDITNISEYTFDHLYKLNTLILSNNKLIAFETQQKFIDLEVFQINNNSLKEIGREIFQNSTKLREINLRNNNLNIHRLLLPSMVILDTFDISNNLASISISSKRISIQNTSTSTYLVHRNCEILDASNNQILNIEFESNIHLTEINLSNNNLTSIRNITHLNNLQQLDLSFNSIKDFAISSFSEMNDLHVLNLKKSGLKSLDFGTFTQQTNLISLDISDNNLKKINFDMLLFLSSLSVLYIDGNELTNIDVSDIKNILPNITTISISRNLFRCHDLISIVKTLNSYQINLNTINENVVKNTTNIRGISCFSESNSIKLLIQKGTDIVELLSTNSTSNLHFDEQISNLNDKINLLFNKSEKEILELKESLQSLKIQFEKRFNEQNQNVSSVHHKYVSASNTSHDAGSDSFQFASTFLIIILILFLFGIGLFLYIKFSSSRRRWYTAGKESSTSADQTLV